jgi:hypothetical protein
MDAGGPLPSSVRTTEESESRNDSGAILEESTIRALEDVARPSAESFDQMDADDFFAEDDFILLSPGEILALTPELPELDIYPRLVDETLDDFFAEDDFILLSPGEILALTPELPEIDMNPRLVDETLGPRQVARFAHMNQMVPDQTAIIALGPREFARFAHMIPLERYESDINIPVVEDEPEVDLTVQPEVELDATMPYIPAIM